jgi:hypothetical protein
LDHEISNLEAIHQQVKKQKEKMLRLSELHKKIDDVTEEMQNISHDTDEREMCPWAISKCFGD